MGGFCRRCGDIIREEGRCAKCGGGSVVSQVSRALFEQPGAQRPADRWLKVYGRRSASPSALALQRQRAMAGSPTATPKASPQDSPRSNSPLKQAVPAGAASAASPGDVSRIATSVSPLVSSDNATPYRLRRGKSVKASAQAHVRSLTSAMADNVELSAAEEEVLSNVFGSVLDPNETRGRCGFCKEIFRRDLKIYPDPRREEGGGFEGVFYCRTCYAREFARGNCEACGKVVIGDENFISLGRGGDRGLWHKSCFRCTHCKTDVSSSPSVDLNGKPCCEDCFERPGAPVTDIPDLRTRTRTVSKAKGEREKMKPAVDELRKRLRSAGLERQASQETRKRTMSTPPTSAPPEPSATAPLNVKKASAPPGSVTTSRAPATASTLPPHPPKAPPPALSREANPCCELCQLPLFRTTHCGGGSIGNIVTLPTSGKSYHQDCLVCDSCCKPFVNGKYVDEGGKKICTSCVETADKQAQEERQHRRKLALAGKAPTPLPWVPSNAKGAASGPSPSALDPSFPPDNSPRLRGPISPRIAESPFFASSSPASKGSPRLGGQPICPGCLKPGTLSETKLGPGGERWHASCLRCVGCRKILDSGAKKNALGDLACSACLDKERATRRVATGSPLGFSASGRLAGLA